MGRLLARGALADAVPNKSIRPPRMKLSTASALTLTKARYGALLSLNRYCRNFGFKRAGFSFQKHENRLVVSYFNQAVLEVSPGFSRDSMRQELRALVEQDLQALVAAIAADLVNGLVLSSPYRVSIDKAYDFPRVLEGEVSYLDFVVARNMCLPEATFRLSPEQGIMAVWVGSEHQRFSGESYVSITAAAIDFFNRHFNGAA